MTAESNTTARSSQRYIAIIGDLRHSRRAVDRAGLQRRLMAGVEDLNDEYWPSGRPADYVVAPVTMTAGDEVQGLFQSGSAAIHVVERLSDIARPDSFTFGIGCGSLSTDINEDVALIDGPAFHNARAALDMARSDGSWSAARGFGSDDQVITAFLYLLGAIRSDWTDRQLEITKVNMVAESQNDVAAQLEISPSAVSESLSAASFRQYRYGKSALLSVIDAEKDRPTE